MNRRLLDRLILISRVQEKRGDLRSMLRRDAGDQSEVTEYVDDLAWISQRLPLQPGARGVTAGKQQLLSTLRGGLRHKPHWSPSRVLAVTFSVSLFLSLVVGPQAATNHLPGPVDNRIDRFIHRNDTQVKAPLHLDLSTPAEVVLEAAAPAFSN